MSDELLKRLDLLASKLNTTGAHLWEVLVEQARVEAIEWTLWSLLWLIFAAGFIWVTRWSWADGKKPEFEQRGPDGLFVWTAACVAICLFVGIGILLGLPGYFINPEYRALKEVLKAVGK